MSYKIALTSLGCSKNLVDSEIMLGLLKENYYIITDDMTEADAIIINTCGFIEAAKRESIETILELAKFKTNAKCKALVVTGCLVQKYKDELIKELPEIDGVLGTSDFHNIVQLINDKLKSSADIFDHDIIDCYKYRHLTTPKHTAYVKIAEGCDNRCTYCIIPELRGKYKSRSMDDILSEVRNLINLGVKEIVLVAQDTTYYGLDIYGEYKLPELLNLLAQENIYWIRLLYCYPTLITQELLDVMAAHDNICKYLDIPLQHADENVLKKMNRKETLESLRELFKKIRNTIPDVALRTTFMVGFPGETEENFQNLLDFTAEIKFDWMGVFMYSREEDTPASKMVEQISDEIKEIRYHRLMSLQTELSMNEKQKWIGKTLPVLVEGKSADDAEYYIGRSQYQAPDVDGVILIKASSLVVGKEIIVHITSSDIYDLIGEIEKNEPGKQINIS